MKEKFWKTIFAGSFITLTGLLTLMLIEAIIRFAWKDLLTKIDPLNKVDTATLLLTLIIATIASRISFNQLLKTNDYYSGKLEIIRNWNRKTILWGSGAGIFVGSFLVSGVSMISNKRVETQPYAEFGVTMVLWATMTTFLVGIVLLKKGNSLASLNQFYHGSARFAVDEEIKEFMVSLNQEMPPGSFFLSSNKQGAVVIPRMEAVNTNSKFFGC